MIVVVLLEGIGMKLDEFFIAKGALNSGLVLLSKANVTVCGSAAFDGLYHITLWSVLTCTLRGLNIVYGRVLFPPPACTLTDEDEDNVALPLLLLLSANATFAITQVIAIAVHVNNVIIILTCCLLFIDNLVICTIDYILFKN